MSSIIRCILSKMPSISMFTRRWTITLIIPWMSRIITGTSARMSRNLLDFDKCGGVLQNGVFQVPRAPIPLSPLPGSLSTSGLSSLPTVLKVRRDLNKVFLVGPKINFHKFQIFCLKGVSSNFFFVNIFCTAT